jgi:indole-3-glycerol phosphate synthase
MSILDQIVREKRAEAARLEPWAAALRRQAEAAPGPRDLRGGLRRGSEVAVVAEVKRRSPSAGWLRRDGGAAGLASLYEHGGAAAVSVLTDGPHFGGSREDLEAVRRAVGVPVLRKDFIVAPVQVYETRAMGADGVLLIVRLLEDGLLRELLGLARELGLSGLVEVHGLGELERALAAGADLVGINNRDLSRFETDLSVTEALAPEVPEEVVLVAESGIGGVEDVDRVAAVGVDAVLVGELVVRSADPLVAVSDLTGRTRSARGRREAAG